MVSVSGRASKNSKAIREYKATGNKAMQSGSFQKAIRLYSKALELDPGNAILYSNRSAAHFNIRQFSESLEDAESSILCDSMWWKAYKRKGLALIHMQRYEEAIEALEEGLKIVGKNAEMEKNLEFARACQEQAQNLYILPEPHMMQRLESVPVFIVTDDVGQPFFVTYDDGQQVCTFYFDQEDAKSTLDWIKTENPDLGDTARVIHITLYQAFNLAQETQKQYYEETTRAAAEEDRAAAAAAVENAKQAKAAAKKAAASKPDGVENGKGEQQKEADDWEEGDTDVDGEKVKIDDEANESSAVDAVEGTTPENSPEEATTANEGTAVSKKTDEPTKGNAEDDVKDVKDGDAESAKKEGSEGDDTDEKKDSSEKKEDDIIIDDNAPLSFQFRPELRQVQVAVELLNKHPNPPVRPILRDPPSIRKAKAEARAAEATKKAAENSAKPEENDASTTKPEETDGTPPTGGDASASTKPEETDGTPPTSGDASASTSKAEPSPGTEEDNDDEELTVDNFNGIPVFQAKGLTLLQKNKQLIPLFFSKWDLEAAWKQLKDSNTIDVPGECEIEVGTLEDILRRMSESKTDEFESVFFVPSREAMKAINVRFPLDELAPPSRPGLVKRPVKKAGFSKARQIAARGGTKDEIRAAIREDLEKHVERQRMAEIIAQIEQARRAGGVGPATGLSKKASKTGKVKPGGVKA